MSDWIAAKSSSKNDAGWLPLEWHLRDTAGVIEYLSKNWLPRAFFDEVGLRFNEAVRYAKLLAYTHDIGKATPGFQQRILTNLPTVKENLENDGFLLGKCLNELRHAHAGASILRSADFPESEAAIVGAHHGKPESDEEGYIVDPDEEIRFEKGMYGSRKSKWSEVQNHLCEWALEQAGYPDASAIPTVCETAQMLFSGLLIMADWISSNTYYFPLISVDDILRDYSNERVKNAMEKLELPEPFCIDADYWRESHFFKNRFSFSENEMQKEAMKIASQMKKPGLMIIEAPMGMGKTEAALAAAEVFLNRFTLGGVAFFLPSQATSNAMFARLLEWLGSLPDADHTAIQLMHSNAELNEQFSSLAAGEIQLSEDDDNQKAIVHGFFRGRKTKLLSSVAVGTIDQLLMAGVKQKHVMLRHLGLAGKVIIIDECHAYDAYMNVYLDRVLQWLGVYQIPVILLSATLPGERRKKLVSAYLGAGGAAYENIEESTSYPLITWTNETQINLSEITYERTTHDVIVERKNDEDIEKNVERVLDAGGCVGIILNTVKRVQAVAAMLEERFQDACVLIDHSQLLLPDRIARENEITARVGKKSDEAMRRNVIVVGSQVLEQSLDIDFDLLITDLCPMDLLMQRLGRLHRHPRKRPAGIETARCAVLHADADDLEAGARAIYGEYLLEVTASILPETVHVPEDISKLVQKTYRTDNWMICSPCRIPRPRGGDPVKDLEVKDGRA